VTQQRKHRLRGQPQLIGDSHSNAAIADVEAKIARMRDRLQLAAPDLILKCWARQTPGVEELGRGRNAQPAFHDRYNQR
jgi:hypothetical protein